MLEVANTILQQLGGNRFTAMTGAKDFVGSADGLSFRLPRGAAKGGFTHIIVRLTPADEYEVTAFKYSARKLDMTAIRVIDGVQAEGLRQAFTSLAGMHTSL